MKEPISGKGKIPGLIVLTLLTFLFPISNVKSQSNLRILLNDGTQADYALDGIKVLNFSSGNVLLKLADNSTSTHALADIKSLSFVEKAVGIKDASSGIALRAYPNPVEDILYIAIPDDVNARATILLMRIDGKIVQSHTVEHNNLVSIDMSSLSKGIYLCRYDNGADVKTLKIIKK